MRKMLAEHAIAIIMAVAVIGAIAIAQNDDMCKLDVHCASN